jgi:hypothetical protein
MKRILVPKGTVIFLAREMNVSSVTIHKALTFQTNSRLAYQIRERAMQEWGSLVEITEIQGPSCSGKSL